MATTHSDTTLDDLTPALREALTEAASAWAYWLEQNDE